MLTAAIQHAAPCPHSTITASPALEAIVTVPVPDIAGSHRVSQMMQMPIHAR